MPCALDIPIPRPGRDPGCACSAIVSCQVKAMPAHAALDPVTHAEKLLVGLCLSLVSYIDAPQLPPPPRPSRIPSLM